VGENIAVLRRHLRKPKFGEYHICAHPLRIALAWGTEPPPCVAAAVFTNVLKDSLLQELADADEGELVKQVQVALRRMPAGSMLRTPDAGSQEYYADYWALDNSLVSLELGASNVCCFMPQTWESQAR
jgi:hypothetical protein